MNFGKNFVKIKKNFKTFSKKKKIAKLNKKRYRISQK